MLSLLSLHDVQSFTTPLPYIHIYTYFVTRILLATTQEYKKLTWMQRNVKDQTAKLTKLMKEKVGEN